MKKYSNGFVCLVCVLLCYPSLCVALAPDEVLVVANRNAARSIGLAKYYMGKRNIPEKNLIKLWVTDKEYCSRVDYNKKIAAPIRAYLKQNDFRKKIRCLVTIYGVPLKVGSPKMSLQETNEEKELKEKKSKLKTLLKQLKEESESKEEQNSIKKELKIADNLIANFKRKHNKSASVDSELSLVLVEDYSLSWWLSNPYFLGFKNRKNSTITKNDVLMVARLDAESDEIVKRIIDDSLHAEKNGLNGTAYFDARWKDAGSKKKFSSYGYGFYDWSIHRAAEQIKKSEFMPVVVENTGKLFEIGQCPEAALYCGWYKLSHYVDSFTWQLGSVGFHIASGECATLKRKNSNAWCKMMLRKGIAATIGPAGEPYVQAFPVPEIFFGFLTEGKLSLAECYLISLPYLSWKMVLVGDPLYKPFSKRN